MPLQDKEKGRLTKDPLQADNSVVRPSHHAELS